MRYNYANFAIWQAKAQRRLFTVSIRAVDCARKQQRSMKVLTLPIKREWFDKILSGEKTHEYREVNPRSGGKYIGYTLNGKSVPFNYQGEVTDYDEVGIECRKYDAIKFLTGAYSGKRPWILVELKNVVHQYVYDEDCGIIYLDSAKKYEGPGVQVYYNLSDEEDDIWLAQRMDYTLGKVLDKDLNP